MEGCHADCGRWALWPSIWAPCVSPGCLLGAMNRHGRVLHAVGWALARVAHVSMAATYYSRVASLHQLHIWVAMETQLSLPWHPLPSFSRQTLMFFFTLLTYVLPIFLIKDFSSTITIYLVIIQTNVVSFVFAKVVTSEGHPGRPSCDSSLWLFLKSRLLSLFFSLFFAALSTRHTVWE